MNPSSPRAPLLDPHVDEASIPVLTERLLLPALEIDVSLPAAAAPAAAPERVPAVAPAPPAPAIDTEALAQRLRETTLTRLQAELAPALETAVRQRVAAAVDDALLDMLALLQVSLESQLRKAVHDAIEDQFRALREPPAG